MTIFRPGDRVRPIKGGPVMEVKGLDKQERVICSWYAVGEGWTQQAFAEHVLRRVRRGRIVRTLSIA
jgi:uncharacterized protein YodC (DUF2158 family)